MLLQALQIGALSCSNVAVHTLSSLGSGTFQLLEQEILTHINSRATYLTGETCLRFIGENSPSPFIREVYNQLYRLMLWGHSLHMFFQNGEKSIFYDEYAEKLLEALHNYNIQGFAASLSELIFLGISSSKKIMLQLGFDEKQLI